MSTEVADGTATRGLKRSQVRLITVFFMIYILVSGGSFGIEDMVSSSGPGLTILLLLLLPIFWSLPMALVASELGSALPDGPEIDLGVANQSGKSVTAYARAADFDATSCVSNTFETEWPPRSGQLQSFPEVDRAEWFAVDEARRRLVKGQVIFLDRLLARLGQSP